MSERTRVVVVGGTSGIGRHFARFCAERGDDVVITGRSAARTKTVADEIGGSTRGLALDLAEPERIADALADVPHVDRLVVAALDRDHNT
ncbi:SDR family NAD(P)-dependent oxidoreductase, partial [Micromonospora sp. D75]